MAMTPADSPSSPEGFASVTPHGRGPAPYDIQAGLEDLSGMAADAVALTGPGSGRQADTESLISSPPGYQDFDIYAGFSGEGSTTHGWPNDAGPPDGD